jgi:hypothetical protein
MKLSYDIVNQTYSIERTDGITYIFDNSNVLRAFTDKTGDQL